MKLGSSVPGHKGKHFRHSDAQKNHDVIRHVTKTAFLLKSHINPNFNRLCGQPVEQGQLDQHQI